MLGTTLPSCCLTSAQLDGLKPFLQGSCSCQVEAKLCLPRAVRWDTRALLPLVIVAEDIGEERKIWQKKKKKDLERNKEKGKWYPQVINTHSESALLVKSGSQLVPHSELLCYTVCFLATIWLVANNITNMICKITTFEITWKAVRTQFLDTDFSSAVEFIFFWYKWKPSGKKHMAVICLKLQLKKTIFWTWISSSWEQSRMHQKQTAGLSQQAQGTTVLSISHGRYTSVTLALTFSILRWPDMGNHL